MEEVTTESTQDQSHRRINFHSPSSVSDPFITVPAGKKQLAFSLCHQLPERSIHFRGKPVLCYRCAGTYGAFFSLMLYQLLGVVIGFGLLLGPIRSWFVAISGGNFLVELLIVFCLHLPMIIDGGLQAWSDSYESRNWLRLLTGLIAGVGQVTFFLLLGSIYFAIF